jgi:uncharacterized cysteine cluster protein YcgN (CxxCxxCC family)
MTAKPFWETKTLAEMTQQEWEALCDGCGRCCLVVLQDDETGMVWETDIACRLFDARTRKCADYKNRHARVPDCVKLTPQNAGALPWMPPTCAYARLARGEGLPDWHPLITGDPNSVARAGITVSRRLFSEADIPSDELEDHVTKRRR